MRERDAEGGRLGLGRRTRTQTDWRDCDVRGGLHDETWGLEPEGELQKRKMQITSNTIVQNEQSENMMRALCGATGQEVEQNDGIIMKQTKTGKSCSNMMNNSKDRKQSKVPNNEAIIVL